MISLHCLFTRPGKTAGFRPSRLIVCAIASVAQHNYLTRLLKAGVMKRSIKLNVKIVAPDGVFAFYAGLGP
jgi:hypothetical protein